jgi:hypothetical protein
VADVDQALAAALGQSTDFAISGDVYKIEPEKTEKPLTKPRVWTFEGYETKYVYP